MDRMYGEKFKDVEGNEEFTYESLEIKGSVFEGNNSIKNAYMEGRKFFLKDKPQGDYRSSFMAYSVLEELDIEVPRTYFNSENRIIASEEIENTRSIEQEALSRQFSRLKRRMDIDKDSLKNSAASKLIVADWDTNPGNILYDTEGSGKTYPIDFEFAGSMGYKGKFCEELKILSKYSEVDLDYDEVLARSDQIIKQVDIEKVYSRIKKGIGVDSDTHNFLNYIEDFKNGLMVG